MDGKGVGRTSTTRRIMSFPVLAVIAVIGFVYYTTIFVFIEELMDLQSSNGMVNAVAFTFFSIMCLYSFAASVLIDPGHVPPDFSPQIDEDPLRNTVQLKYCDKCCIYKPARAHHCRVCRRCVLKMDHHCFWINNCVGYRNYKPFIIFVMYAAIASIYSTVIFVSNVTQKDHQRFDLHHTLFYVMCGSIIIMLSLVLGTLLGWHIYLVSQNMTTIEHRGSVRAMWLAQKSGQKYHHPFDVGVFKNITLILGPNMLKWFWPMAVGHLKDGIQFPVYHD